MPAWRKQETLASSKVLSLSCRLQPGSWPFPSPASPFTQSLPKCRSIFAVVPALSRKLLMVVGSAAPVGRPR